MWLWWYLLTPAALLFAISTSLQTLKISNEDSSEDKLPIQEEFIPPKGADSTEVFDNLQYKLKQYESYEIPTPEIELLHPKGFRISIPDEKMEMIALNIDLSVNKRLKRNKYYDFYNGATHVTAEKGQIWSRKNDSVVLRDGDVVIYAALGIHFQGAVCETPEYFANISVIYGRPTIIDNGFFPDDAESIEEK